MMECPRCNFQQPPDRYCANCGLDIESFNRRPKSVFHKIQKLGKNPVLYVALAVMLFAGAGILISSGLSRRSSEMTAAPPSAKLEAPNAQFAPPDNPQNATADSADAEERTAAPQEAAPTAQLQAATPPPATAEGQAAPAAAEAALAADNKAAPSEIKEYVVQFYEFERGELQTFLAGAKSLGSGRGVRTYSIPDKEKLHGPNLQMQSLAGGARSRSGEPLSMAFGGDSLTMDFRPDKINAEGLTLEVEVIWREGKSDESRISGAYVVSPQGSVLIVGLVPHQVPHKPEGLDGPLQVLNSPDFTQNLSEFVIVLSLN